MEVVTEKSALRAALRDARTGTVGFVPTMGFLHDGHVSLITAARKENAFVVVSIYVNPTQFGENEDLDAYPSDIEGDLARCRDAGVDLVWIPTSDIVYQPDHTTTVHVDALTVGLCGRSRPTHFDGVTTIVTKLFNLVQPDRAYFGQKDYQQLAIIRRMVRDLDVPVEIRGMPTIREADGLALSSRNTYLDAEQRTQGLALSKSLIAARQAYAEGIRSAATLRALMTELVSATPGTEIDYIEIVHPETLTPITDDIDADGAVAALAVKVGPARLIDNARLDLTESNNLPPTE